MHREPVVNNVLATEAERVLAGRRYNDALWLTVRADAPALPMTPMTPDAGEVVGAAMHTPPLRLFICPMPASERPALVGDHSFRARRACQPTIA